MTRNQYELLNFIKGFIAEHGYAPAFTDMMAHMGRASKSHIFKMLKGLEEQGQIVRLKHRARAIEIPDNPAIPRDLSAFSNADIAHEAERRGLVLGHILRDESGSRTFRKYGNMLDVPA